MVYVLMFLVENSKVINLDEKSHNFRN